MKLVHLLDTIAPSTVIWVAPRRHADGVFLGYARDAGHIIDGRYLFGDVRETYGEYYRGFDAAGISILVTPYDSEPNGEVSASDEG